VAKEAALVEALPGVLPELLLQGGEGAVVADGDCADAPGHGGEVGLDQARPPPGRQPAEHEDRQIGDVDHDDHVG
jgi:hypothetical protein